MWNNHNWEAEKACLTHSIIDHLLFLKRHRPFFWTTTNELISFLLQSGYLWLQTHIYIKNLAGNDQLDKTWVKVGKHYSRIFWILQLLSTDTPQYNTTYIQPTSLSNNNRTHWQCLSTNSPVIPMRKIVNKHYYISK